MELLMKTCGKCKVKKGLDEFHRWTKGPASALGRQNYCKACNNSQRLAYFYEHHEAQKKLNRERARAKKIAQTSESGCEL